MPKTGTSLCEISPETVFIFPGEEKVNYFRDQDFQQDRVSSVKVAGAPK